MPETKFAATEISVPEEFAWGRNFTADVGVDREDCFDVLCCAAALDGSSGEARAGHEQGVEGDIFEEAEFKAQGKDLVWLRRAGEVVAAGAEVGERGMGGAGEFEPGGDERGVEFDDGAQLDFEAELHAGGREGFALEDPAPGVGKGRGEEREEPLPILIAVSLELECLHWVSVRGEAFAFCLGYRETGGKADRSATEFYTGVT